MKKNEIKPLREKTDIRDTKPKNIIDGSSQEDQLEKFKQGKKSQKDSPGPLNKHIDQPEEDENAKHATRA